MNIAVWCGSDPGNNPDYLTGARALGTWIGEQGHTLVYGGSDSGLMGAVADACLAAGGQVIGVHVNIPRIVARRHTGLTQNIETTSMAERKTTMMNLADAFVALPGGPGTLDEISDVLSLIRADALVTKLALYNIDGFYNKLNEFFHVMIDAGFVGDEAFSTVLVSDSLREICSFITGN